ncbi:two-component sensor histidine kinase, partial [bacterium]|nr:two-component sensor histidine kinase [bacterium]
VVVLFMTLFAWVNINNLQSLLVNNTVRDLDNLASTIIRMTRHQMLLDNRPLVYQMINEVANRPGVDRIRMINREGIIVHSTVADEVGKPLDQKAVRCTLCHKPGRTLSHLPLQERNRFFTLPGGKQVMGFAKSVHNESSCSTAACHAHAGSQKVLGVVDIIVSLDLLKA